MNYRNMIEPYLYGNLNPEEEVAFERQMSRDSALFNETCRRLNAEKVLSEIQDFHAAPRRSSLPRTLFWIGFVAMLLGLAWWKMQPSNEARVLPADTPVIQSEVPSH
ncbi:MAG: hypothetical protein OHK0019_24730 [Saprospiraceae bacterium]